MPFLRNHIPLNAEISIQTKESYDFYMAKLNWLLDQLKTGLDPAWFITFQHKHPSEKVRRIKGTNF